MEPENIPKKRGRKPKPKPEVTDVVKKKRGRKPTGKIYDNADTSQIKNVSDYIVTFLPLSDETIDKVIDECADSEPKVKVREKASINFNLESDSDLKHRLNEKIKEYEELKKKYDELNEKYEQYKFLETIVTDNGSIDKKYYVSLCDIIDNSGDYKQSTDKWCKWCCHSFDTLPLGMPIAVCQQTKKFKCIHNFCSFNCMHAYNISLNDGREWERLSYMKRIKKQIYGNDPLSSKPIIAAGPVELLDVHGGEQTIEQFRNNQISVPKEYNVLMPPAIPLFTVIEEIPNYFNKINSMNYINKLKNRRARPGAMKTNNLLAQFT